MHEGTPVEEFSGSEKIAYLPRELDTEDSPGSDQENGHLIYCAPWGLSEGTAMKIRFTVGDVEFDGELYGNPVAEEFWGTLPTEVLLRDFNKIEKVGRVAAPLTLRGVPQSDAPGPGEIGYYAPTQGLALYYGHVGKWPGLVRLGRFDLDLDVLKALPDGSRALIELR